MKIRKGVVYTTDKSTGGVTLAFDAKRVESIGRPALGDKHHSPNVRVRFHSGDEIMLNSFDNAAMVTLIEAVWPPEEEEVAGWPTEPAKDEEEEDPGE